MIYAIMKTRKFNICNHNRFFLQILNIIIIIILNLLMLSSEKNNVTNQFHNDAMVFQTNSDF